MRLHTIVGMSVALSGCLFSSSGQNSETDSGASHDVSVLDLGQGRPDGGRPDLPTVVPDKGSSDVSTDVDVLDVSRDAGRAQPFFLGYRRSSPPLQPEENTCVECRVGDGSVATYQFIYLKQAYLVADNNGRIVEPYALRTDWETTLGAALDAAQFDVDQGFVHGFNLGEDLFYFGLTSAEVESVADFVAQRFGDLEIWLTLEPTVVSNQETIDQTPIQDFRIPNAVTLVSVYAWRSGMWDGTDDNFVEAVKSLHDDYVFTRLNTRQRVVLAPQATANPNNACDLQCWDRGLARDVDEYFAWAVEHERIVGLAPWAWAGMTQTGLQSLPETRAAYVGVRAALDQNP